MSELFTPGGSGSSELHTQPQCPSKCGPMRVDQEFDALTGEPVSSKYYVCDRCGHTESAEIP